MSNKKFPYRIYYEDTDAGGIVYYANYLKIFERARTDFLREVGINQMDLIEKENLAFVVRKCEIEFLSSAKLDDLVFVDVEIEEISAVTIKMRQKIFLDEKLLTTLKVEIVCINSVNSRPSRISEKIKNLICKK